ncbi:hypothetical protein ACET3Z_003857 [Daucus carota]
MPSGSSLTKFSSKGKVKYAITNFAALLAKELVHPNFHPLMDFLKNSPISYALTASPTIYAEIVQDMWSTADCSTEGEIKFTIKGKSYILTPALINEALQLPDSNFENFPTHDETISMLKAIGYEKETVLLSKLCKKSFRKEWWYFFVTLNMVFAGKYSSYLSTFVLKIAYSLLYARRIDIGRLLLDEFFYKLGDKGKRSHAIFYARFLMIIANSLCKELQIEDRDDTVPVCMQPKNMFTQLVRDNSHSEVEFVLPEHVRVQLSMLSSSHSRTSSSVVLPALEDGREGHTFPTPLESENIASSLVSDSGKRKQSTLPTTTVHGNETTPEVYPPQKRRYAGEVKASKEENPRHDLLCLIEPAREAEDRQHLMKAASVLKSRLVAHLTSFTDRPSAQDMRRLADRCYETLEGLGDDHDSFRTEVDKLIAQQQELEISAKKREDWNDWDINAHYNDQVHFLSDLTQKLTSVEDQLSTAKTKANSIRLKREELTVALHKLKDQCKEAHSVAEAELAKLNAEKEKARVAYREIDDQYNTASRKFERMSHHLQHLVRKL